MELTTILLIIVSILMFLTGLSVLMGSIKQERAHLIWFFVAMIGGTIWSLTSGMYAASVDTPEINTLWWLSYGICFGSLMASLGLLGYSIARNKAGKTLLVVLCLLSFALMLVPFFNESLLASITKGQLSWFYIGYGCLILINFGITLVNTIVQAAKAKVKKVRNSKLMFLCGLLFTLGISLTFNMVFPFILQDFHLLWIGPLSIFILVLAFYLTLFSNHQIVLRSVWFRILSYLILIASFAVLYMVLFFIIFKALFRTATPTTSVIFLNFIMVIVVLLLTPVIIEIGTFIKSLISVDQIDVGYILKKLKKVDSRHVKVQDLAEFLGSHLHLAYFGIVVNGRLYESENIGLDADTLKAIDTFKPVEHTIWQDLGKNAHGQLIKKHQVVAMADLYNNDSEAFGKVLIGKPINGRRLSRRELVQLEAIVNMTALILTPNKRTRK